MPMQTLATGSLMPPLQAYTRTSFMPHSGCLKHFAHTLDIHTGAGECILAHGKFLGEVPLSVALSPNFFALFSRQPSLPYKLEEPLFFLKWPFEFLRNLKVLPSNPCQPLCKRDWPLLRAGQVGWNIFHKNIDRNACRPRVFHCFKIFQRFEKFIALKSDIALKSSIALKSPLL